MRHHPRKPADLAAAAMSALLAASPAAAQVKAVPVETVPLEAPAFAGGLAPAPAVTLTLPISGAAASPALPAALPA
ncbi:MAG: helix-turn-helix domain-containing protein, partial [Elusimicrobia bacterium]|nr:helix-turn-helix domain-containing protein [Elusimicrobiota bacterium]